jgi:parallel beta-helix repeat protein
MRIRIRNVIAVWLLLGGSILAPRPVHAAESYGNCSKFIDSLPATLSTQGVYCLRKDLSTGLASGNAINIAANNVTIDCNDFKIGGLAAGDGSTADGIFVGSQQNATIRNCNIRGFGTGLSINGGGGHLVEDNRFDNNLTFGIYIAGDHNMVRNNRVYATGGYATGTLATGIYGSAHMVGNDVNGVVTAATTAEVHGIWATGTGTDVIDNRIGGLALTGSGGLAYGIQVSGNNQTLARNHVSAAAVVAFGHGVGILGHGNANTFCIGNSVADFTTPIDSCQKPTPDDNVSL